MIKKRFTGFILIVFTLCLLAGCSIDFPQAGKLKIDSIDADIECEFRLGKNAQFSKTKALTDAVFDKEEFIELFNLRESYDPLHIRLHLDECSLKIVASKQPEEMNKMSNSEINFKVVYDGVDERKDSVSVYEYNSKLYFFVLCMGSRSKEEDIGYYYMELPEDMQEYWLPIIKKVREDDKANKEKEYGSFTIEKTFSYDKKYYAECVTRSTGAVYIDVYERASNIRISSFTPCRSSDFWGICWEYDNYNLWIQSADIGIICYSFNGEEWVRNKDAVKPDYIISKW
ncbi:MAG: hypothetical protein IKW88_05045 [Clostridiales bacterium]|nr:hypothetical protein [Clostridiales bacterium]